MGVRWKRNAAYRYLKSALAETREFQTVTSLCSDLSGDVRVVVEIFSSMIILDLLAKYPLDDRVKSNLVREIDKWYLADNLIAFYGERKLPPDVDTTAVGIGLLTELGSIERGRALDSVDKILLNTSPNGVISVWFAPIERTDAVVCANAMYLLYLYEKEGRAKATEQFLSSLLQGSDEEISRYSPYYCSPDALLYALSRSVMRFPKFRKKFAPALKKKLQDRIGTTEQPMDWAMRTIVAKAVGVDNAEEAEKLAAAQAPQGYWLEAPFFTDGKDRDGDNTIYFGSKELVSAFCIRALEAPSVRRD